MLKMLVPVLKATPTVFKIKIKISGPHMRRRSAELVFINIWISDGKSQPYLLSLQGLKETKQMPVYNVDDSCRSLKAGLSFRKAKIGCLSSAASS
jgi:hypothetical protein